MTTFLCTAGTSVSTGLQLKLDHLAKRKLSEWDALQEDRVAIEQFVTERTRAVTGDDCYKLSAEINSLLKMGLVREDRVVLVSTETVEGRLCAELVADILRDKGLCDSVEIEVVEGLQAQEGQRFRRVGIKNLMAFLIRFEHQNVVFNMTAGLKGVVPYITLAGMLFRKPVQYIHEYSDDLMTLVNLPIGFDDDLIFLVEDKLEKIEQETFIPQSEWQVGLDGLDPRLESLIETFDDHVTMSGLGLLLWERFKKDFPANLNRDPTEPRQKQLDLPELVTDQRESQDKDNKLDRIGLEHHGTGRLRRMASRLLSSPYVQAVPNSTKHHPEARKWVKALGEKEAEKYTQVPQKNICLVTLVDTDAGYSFLVRTTAREEKENRQIAEILTRKYFG